LTIHPGREIARVVRRRAGQLRRVSDHVRPAPPVDRIVDDAGTYWTGRDDDPAWEGNAHWRSALGEEHWHTVGAEHLAIFGTFAKALDLPATPGVVVEWGCGGGANAVAFAPVADEFVAVDVSGDSVEECVRQVAMVCDTPVVPLVVDIRDPERAAEGREGSCDTFICLYVVEVLPSVADVKRILRVAERMLVPGGVAFVQMKYHTADWRPRAYKRDYARSLSTMTTFGIDEFWSLTAECGLTPRLVTLVPENHLDTRYAYYALTKDAR
jgi:SAM-dependent methyltransferase